jgi:hypothetical protein
MKGKKIVVLHIFDYQNFHLKIESVIYENIKRENKSGNIESYLYAPKYQGEGKYIFNKNENLDTILKIIKVDIVVFHSLYKLEYLKHYKKIIQNNIPYFIRPHGSFSKVVMKKNKIKKFILNYIVFKKFIKKAAGYIYLSKEEEKNSYLKKNRDKQVYYLPNMIEIENSSPKIKVDNNINLIYLGKFDFYYKNILLMLEVLKRISEKRKDVTVNLYGPIESKKNKILNKYLSDKIIYNGEVFGKEKNEAYSKADIFILLSKSEGMPMVILEALNKNLACFVSKNTNVGEKLESYKVGWSVELTQVDEIVEKLNMAIDEYKENKELIYRNIMLLLEKEFQWNMKKNQEIYENIIELKDRICKNQD